MWLKAYRDYPSNEPIIKEQAEPGNGIIGCEMHDINGWGNEYERMTRSRMGPITRLLYQLFGIRKS